MVLKADPQAKSYTFWSFVTLYYLSPGCKSVSRTKASLDADIQMKPEPFRTKGIVFTGISTLSLHAYDHCD